MWTEKKNDSKKPARVINPNPHLSNNMKTMSCRCGCCWCWCNGVANQLNLAVSFFSAHCEKNAKKNKKRKQEIVTNSSHILATSLGKMLNSMWISIASSACCTPTPFSYQTTMLYFLPSCPSVRSYCLSSFLVCPVWLWRCETNCLCALSNFIDMEKSFCWCNSAVLTNFLSFSTMADSCGKNSTTDDRTDIQTDR